MAVLKCKHCGEALPQYLENGRRRHGNQKYHKHCYEEEKLKRQTVNYSRGREVINQLIKNDVILERWFAKLNDAKMTNWTEISKDGFDHNLYTGEDKMNKIIIKRQLEYGYSIVNSKGSIYIKVHKL